MTARKSYIVDRVLHWLSALAILLLLTDMGTRIHYVDYEIKGIVQHKQDAIEVHMTYALVLFLALITRMVWRKFFLHQEHQLKFNNPKHKYFVSFIHIGMYLTLGLMMITGLAMVNNYEHLLTFYQILSFSDSSVDRQLFTKSNEWHLWFENLTYLLIVIHVSGAIYNRR